MSAFLFGSKDGPNRERPAPARRSTTALVLAPWAMTAMLALALGYVLLFHHGGRPTPDGGLDRRFVAIGKAHVARLGHEYADAWDDGAKLLDAGQPVATAIEAVARSWEANRVAGFDGVITPEFSKVLPQSKPEKDVTAAERAALARAWRGFSRGLRSR